MFVIACIEHGCLWKHSEQLRQRWVKHDNNMKDYSWWLTDHCNCQSFKLFSLWQSQHAVCHCQESGKTATQLPNALVIKWIYNIVLFGGKNAGCSFFITFNWCICSLFLTLVSDGRLQWPRLRNSRTLFAQSDVNLFNHLVGKRMLRVVDI